MKLPRIRRLKKKTDYKARFNLLKSEKPRLVIRKTNRYLIVQVVKSEIAQDSIICGLTTKDLLKKGWPENKKGSLKNRAAGYAVGFLVGKKAKSKKVDEVILDTGMNRNIHKSRLYAVLKGAVDAGLKIPHKEETLPTMEEIKSKKGFAEIITKITG